MAHILCKKHFGEPAALEEEESALLVYLVFHPGPVLLLPETFK